jgi:hypothetical protein
MTGADPNVEIYFCDVYDRPLGDSESISATSAYNAPARSRLPRRRPFQLHGFYVGQQPHQHEV